MEFVETPTFTRLVTALLLRRARVQEFLHEWLGVELSVGTIHRTLHEAAAALALHSSRHRRPARGSPACVLAAAGGMNDYQLAMSDHPATGQFIDENGTIP